jgi:L-lactate dehydrogenase complex protein LldF
MGAVLTPVMLGIEKTNSLPNACTLNGRCQEVCPMQIPLPSMLRHLREREYAQNLTPILARAALALWALVAQRPKLYAIATRIAVKALSVFAGRRGRLRWLPFASAWTDARDLPAPAGETFQQAYRKRMQAKSKGLGG